MGTFSQWVYTTCSILLAVRLVSSDRPFTMVKSPEPIAAPLNDEATMECEMNIRPDKFRWRHFPFINNSSDSPQIIDTERAIEVNPSRFRVSGKKSTLILDLNSPEAYGDYQCLVHYGVAVFASVLGRVSIAEIDDFGPMHVIKPVVPIGNTVPLHCDIPRSNPPADVQYFKIRTELNSSLVLPTKTLLLQNVTVEDSGTYNCSATNYLSGVTKKSNSKIILVVDPRRTPLEPRFLTPPPSNYTVTAGEDVFLECAAIGYPPPKVRWIKLNGQLPNRAEQVPGGLKISNVISSDQGTYVCSYGNLRHSIMLLFYEHPNVSHLPPIDMKEGEDVDAECTVKGTPEPTITWLINGQGVMNDTNIEAIGNKIYFRPIEKRHAGIIQCFATNAVGTAFIDSFVKVYPKQISSDNSPTHAPSANTKLTRRRKKGRRPKKPKSHHQTVMIPPSKPNITRISDYSVMVRWSVPENNGLPISFFKVQYRELGLASQLNQGNHGRSKGSRWKTTNADITPYLRSYQIENLKPDYVYKFRIAAVYSNNDNKLGPNSAKFHLKREDFFIKNPIPAPRLTHTESLSSTEIKIHWEYTPDPNITIDGFYVNYQPASSAGDYYKVTVDGAYTRSYIINHLQPDTFYDIKIQSYTTNSVSDFSSILKQKTMRGTTESPSTQISTPSSLIESTDFQLIYIIIGVSVVVLVLIITIITIFVIKKKKNGGDNDNKSGAAVTEDGGHHIQADSNGYVTKPVAHNLTNGCSPSRGEITITANPLADADDNQNQNMIEMASLSSSQNNNCSNTEPSISNENEQPTSPKSKNKSIKHRDSSKNRGKLKPETSANENYV